MTEQTGSGAGGVNAPVSESAASNPAQAPTAVSEQRSNVRPREEYADTGQGSTDDEKNFQCAAAPH